MSLASKKEELHRKLEISKQKKLEEVKHINMRNTFNDHAVFFSGSEGGGDEKIPQRDEAQSTV